MRDNYDPPTGPAPWERARGPQPPVQPTRPIAPQRDRGAWSFDEDPYGDHPGRLDAAAAAARAAGLKRMSKLTWRATQLSALAAVGFAALFARSAPPSHTVAASTTPSAKPSPSPSPTPTHHKRRHHHKAKPTPTLAAPTTPPAPPPPAPSPTPVTTSGGSGG